MTLKTKNDAVKLFTMFVNENLNGNVENLRGFDFREVKDSLFLGCPDRPFDCDNCNIINAIYILLWSDKLPDCSFDTIGIGKPYRGDTMNTFNTLFGREIENQHGFYAGLEKYNPSDELRNKARTFHQYCCNIGNFVIMPNISHNGMTINTHRGTNDWRDFFDQFLMNLNLCLTNQQCSDNLFNELFEKNRFCFDLFNLKEFARLLYLDDYLDENHQPNQVFRLNYHWKNIHNIEQYIADANMYIDNVIPIIQNRADKIIEKLKAFYDLEEDIDVCEEYRIDLLNDANSVDECIRCAMEFAVDDYLNSAEKALSKAIDMAKFSSDLCNIAIAIHELGLSDSLRAKALQIALGKAKLPMDFEEVNRTIKQIKELRYANEI